MRVATAGALVLAATGLAFALSGSDVVDAQVQQDTARVDSARMLRMLGDSTFTRPDLSKFQRMSSGLMYYDVVTGTGTVAVDLRDLQVHYVGRLQDSSVFDNSVQRDKPLPLTLGRRSVIPGWEAGLRGMRAGGRRIMVIPPALAYGAAGSPPVIPPNATLVFDVWLVSVR